VEVIEANSKTRVVSLVGRFNGIDELLGDNALALGAQHDGCAVGIISANIDAVIAAHLL
jgi:hypothetical protein